MDIKAAAAELVFIPYPGMGHLVSTAEMAKQLIGRDHRLSITVLMMKTAFDKSKVVSTTECLLLEAAEDRLKFVELPHDNEAVAELLSKNDGNFIREFVSMYKRHVRDHVTKTMISTESTRTPLAGFVIDMLCTPMMDVAAEFGLPTYIFFASGCAFLGLMFHLETLTRDHNQDVTELKDSDAELEVPVFRNPVPAKVLPGVVVHKEGGSSVFLGAAKRWKEAKGIMVNTFEELESYAVKRLAEDDKVPSTYMVGPVLKDEKEENENEEVMQIMRWLDLQPPSSVVFLCFGSKGSFDDQQVREIAQALEQSGHRFLWSVRQPPPKDRPNLPSEYQDLNQVLPEGFLERTTKIGKVIGWAPQMAVLSHKSVGGFVSHCGWNSIIESLWCGVPMVTWPMYSEQQLNAFQLVRELGLAVEIKLDYNNDMKYGNAEPKLVTSDEIENGIRKLMESGDNSGSEGIKQKVQKMSKNSKVTLQEGGSSYNSIGRFIEDVIVRMHSP